MDRDAELIEATRRTGETLAETKALKEKLEKERESIHKVRRAQRIWWIAVFLAGFGVGYFVAEMLIDPVTIFLPSGGIDA